MAIENIPKQLEALKLFRGPLILVLITVVLVLGILLKSIRFGEVSGTEVGVLLNNLTGEIEVIDTSGTKIYNGITKKFYALDKTVQQLSMSGAGHLKVKTVDGSDVQLDLTVMYRIKLDQIKLIVADSGPGEAYKRKWVRDYARSICRNSFGELTTEEFYDAAKRNEKALKALAELNVRLNPHGISVTNINPQDFRFHEEYRRKIDEKKLADQSVEEEVSKALAAVQSMARMRVEATKEMDVALMTYTGAMRELVVTAEAEAQRDRQAAEAYSVRKRIGAEAEYYQMQKSAEAILVEKQAEAEGVAQMAKALTGEGGLNIVKMEYAKKLGDMTITGQPFLIQSITERFEHVEESGGPMRGVSARDTAAQGVNP